jgi:hypothetical protein
MPPTSSRPTRKSNCPWMKARNPQTQRSVEEHNEDAEHRPKPIIVVGSMWLASHKFCISACLIVFRRGDGGLLDLS